MEPRRLSEDQIDKLYTFTRKHFVEYYDLQTELVDHLANDIETQWQQNRNPKFDDALTAAFKKFGIYGFEDVVNQRKKALGKRYMKLMGRYFLEFFTLPKILLTIALVLGVHQLLLIQDIPVFSFAILGVQVFSFIKLLQQKRVLDSRIIATGRKWLFEELIYKGVTMTSVLVLTGQFIGSAERISKPGTLWVISFLYVMLLLHNYIVLYSIPAKAEKYLKETYPEYGLEISQ